jgi:hypothetical protein
MMPLRALALFASVALVAACGATVGSSSPVTSGTFGHLASPVAIASATISPPPSPVGSASAATPTPRTTPLGPPPPPTAVAFTTADDPSGGGYGTTTTTTTTMTVTWKEAPATGVEVRVFGVTKCLPPPGLDSAPCLVEHTPLPPSDLVLIAKAPASRGKVSWTWPAWGDIGGNIAVHGNTSFASFVVAAYNAAGHSKFVIVVAAGYCATCVY